MAFYKAVISFCVGVYIASGWEKILEALHVDNITVSFISVLISIFLPIPVYCELKKWKRMQ